MKYNKDMLKLAAALVVGGGAVTTAWAYDPQKCMACYSEWDGCASLADANYANCIAMGESPGRCESEWTNDIMNCDITLADCESQWCC
jgi:hypothetical protein